MRIIPLMLLALFAAFPNATTAAEAGSTRVRALLVIASNQPGGSDSRLSAYEPTLRRILRFESYRLVGEGSASVAPAGKASIRLGQGHSLALENQRADGRGGSRLQLGWQQGGRSLMNTGVALRPGVPAVLGGPSTGKEGEVWAVIVIAE